VRLGLTDEHVTVAPVREADAPLVAPVETAPVEPETEARR
jgi:hypothetical protein